MKCDLLWPVTGDGRPFHGRRCLFCENYDILCLSACSRSFFVGSTANIIATFYCVAYAFGVNRRRTMTLWIWLVAAIVLVLVGFEMYHWFKRRSAPVEEANSGEESGAELARADA